MRPITADTVAASIDIDDLRARVFVLEQANDRLMRDNRCYQDELSQLLEERRKLNTVVNAALRGCNKCEYEDGDVIKCVELAGCGFAPTRSALDALRERGTHGPCQSEA